MQIVANQWTKLDKCILLQFPSLHVWKEMSFCHKIFSSSQADIKQKLYP